MKKAFQKLNIRTKKWIKAVKNSYILQEHHERLLVLCGQAWDRSQQARDIIDSDGAIILDRFGVQKQHPAVQIETTAMITFSRLLRELGLDLEPPPETRPNYRPGGYR